MLVTKSIQIQHLLKLNLVITTQLFLTEYSNTTLVKVKCKTIPSLPCNKLNSNTTLVKVKLVTLIATAGKNNIQIQHLLKLNGVNFSFCFILEYSNTTLVKVKL